MLELSYTLNQHSFHSVDVSASIFLAMATFQISSHQQGELVGVIYFDIKI